MAATYLLRFDDCCPTMNWDVWRQVEEFLVSSGVKPILAVVPDNQDQILKVREPHRGFWDEVRRWQSRGWTIGLHGYQHRYVTDNAGLMGINPFSEFSGLPYDEQREKLHRALAVFERESIRPALWIAPGHSFDVNTLCVLRELGISYLSDGFSFFPHVDSDGMMWVPQQLWRFRKMPVGTWTVCLHLNRWGTAEIETFRSNLEEFGSLLTDWDRVVSRYRNRRRSFTDSVFAQVYPAIVKARRRLRHLPISNGGQHQS